MAMELKTDSRQRYMLYRGDERYLRFEPQARRQEAADAGRKYTLAAYPDIWANDVGLVARVRQFLGANFHWHDRLVAKGSDLEVVQVLHDMVRGGSVVVIAERPVSVGSAGVGAPPPVVKKSFHQLVMEGMGLSANAAWDYIDQYNAMVDRVNEIEAARKAITGNAMLNAMDDFSSDGIPTGDFSADTPSLLSDAQPFEYTKDTVDGDAFQLAKTPNEGEPGTWYTNPGSGQMRLFGSNGRPVVDIDYDHDHGQGLPHAHHWTIDPFSGNLKRGPGLAMPMP
ncbi:MULTISPECIES: hypothetical protein [Paraburkholderia]|jgi:hypothetical protein|uniref:hypothetical protein n=1 Tax=Paraburkholderia TaxID=1822464 RepID=UPI001B10A46A|nr:MULTISPECIES: hypothetical protein [Paraburkholderia]MCX4156966.1 hypothetical protein [Paraburkholderia aspalathi]MDN7166370.1 hypothetical protein [Paraburkholderia sp. SECH2]MDQ6394856.1 hypothetical protein [Paraburkholderia aspalathi]CAE6745407.1 hypothetical protein R75465_02469 [Paraburkholderia aspalathi]CAE6830284.1 hypothetical protein R20943_06601 [Paraburkholderia aspalathi]